MPAKEINITPDKDFVSDGPKTIVVLKDTPPVLDAGGIPVPIDPENPPVQEAKSYRIVTYKPAVSREGVTLDIVDTVRTVTLDQLEWKLASLIKQQELLASFIADTQANIDTIKGTP